MKLPGSKRFILRTIQKGDEFDIAKNANDKTISRNTSAIPHPYKLKYAQDFVRKFKKKSRAEYPQDLVFVIVVDSEVIGCVGLHKIIKNHKSELGYWLAKKYWGKGIVPEAVKIVTNFAFRKLKLKRVYARVYSFNMPSMKVLEKNGYKLEGIFKKDVEKEGRFFDTYNYAKVK